jgi:serine acetyltransferase
MDDYDYIFGADAIILSDVPEGMVVVGVYSKPLT